MIRDEATGEAAKGRSGAEAGEAQKSNQSIFTKTWLFHLKHHQVRTVSTFLNNTNTIRYRHTNDINDIL